jgi:hypothetical protein
VIDACGAVARAIAQQGGPLVRERNGRVIALEPYAPNMLCMTMRIDKSFALGRATLKLHSMSLMAVAHSLRYNNRSYFRV